MHGALRKQGRWSIQKDYKCAPRDAVLHIFERAQCMDYNFGFELSIGVARTTYDRSR